MTKGEQGIADADRAFGKGPDGKGPTLATRAAYLKEYGSVAFEDEMKKWNASKFNLKPGTRPEAYGDGADDATRRDATRKTNPWSEAFEKKHGHAAATKDRIAIIQLLGSVE
jgi:hypothetical protein